MEEIMFMPFVPFDGVTTERFVSAFQSKGLDVVHIVRETSGVSCYAIRCTLPDRDRVAELYEDAVREVLETLTT